MSNLFASAKVEKPKAKATKASQRLTLPMEEVEALAALNALQESIEAITAGLDARIKERSMVIYVDAALGANKKPESFNLTEGLGTAQFQLRKRAVTSALTDAEVAILNGYGVPTEKRVSREECFKFRSEVLADPEMAQRISDALTADPILAEMDLIVKQEAISTNVVAETTMDTAIKTIEDKDHLKAVLKIAGVPALKTAFISKKMEDAMEALRRGGIDLFAPATPAAPAAPVPAQ